MPKVGLAYLDAPCNPTAPVLDDFESVTGRRPPTCPWRSYDDPFAAIVSLAYRWWDKGQLEHRFGGRVPSVVVHGLTVFAAAKDAESANQRRIRDAEKRRPDSAPTPPTPLPRGAERRRKR